MRFRAVSLIVLLAFAMLGTSLAAEAQPAPGLRRIVVVTIGVNPRSAPFNVAFENRLRELGWVLGQTLAVEFIAPKPGEDLAQVAAAAVRRMPDVIVAPGPEEPLQAVRRSTATIPIVMVANNYDPVAKGHVASLARPGGNVTGVFYQQLEVDVKQLELLSQILVKGARVAVIWNPNSADQLQAVEAAARQLGTPIQKVEVPPPYDFEAAFKAARQGRAKGVLVLGSPVAFRDRARISQLALRHRLPSMGTAAMTQDSGMLLGFGPDLNALFRRAAEYVDKILKGAKPADLPIEQPTKFELVINLKTAKALGLTIPPAILIRADQVIE